MTRDDFSLVIDLKILTKKTKAEKINLVADKLT